MKAKDFILIALFLGGFAFLYITTKKENNIATDHKIDSLYRVHGVLYDLDSIERRITSRIVDSIALRIDSLKIDIKIVGNKYERLRKQNDELIKKYEVIQVTRPDF